MATIQGIYLALFERPADPLGLEFFNEATNGGEDLTAIGDLAATEEYQSRFEGMTDVQIVNSIYQSLFGRDADLEGLTFFVEALQSGEQDINSIAINIYDGAQNEDLEVLTNKETAANAFTESLDTGEKVAAYDGEDAAAAARALLAGVTADEDTIPTQAEIDSVIQAIVDGDHTPGDGFNFTSAIGELLVGTSGNDSFTGVLDGATDGTFQTGDQADGGAGVDTLDLFIENDAGTADGLPTGASIRNIDIVNLVSTGGTLAAGFSAAAFAGASEIWQVNDAVDIAGVGADVTAGFRDTAVDGQVAFTDASGSIALDGVEGGGTVTAVGQDLSELSLSGSVSQAGVTGFGADLDIDIDNGGGDTVTALNLALESNVELAIAAAGAADLVTFDASESAGGIRINLISVPADALALESAALGSGNDWILLNNVAFGSDDVAIDLGAGNDRIDVGLQATGDTDLSLTGGAGANTFVFSGGNINMDGSALEGSVSITDFGESDVLALEGFAGFSSQTVVDNAIEGLVDDATLFDAVAAVAAALGGAASGLTGWAQFEFAGNTYVYGDVDDTGLDDGDMLLEFAGGAELSGDNVVGFTPGGTFGDNAIA